MKLLNRLRIALLLIALGALGAASVATALTVVTRPSVPSSTSAGSLDVLPFPGTPDASPETEIDFPALAPGTLRSITVSGSHSGAHTGRLRPLPRGGLALTPTRPFAPGEQVSVRALLSSPGAARASGAHSSTRLSFGFGVATPKALTAARQAVVRHDIRDSNGFTRSFRSVPGMHPPIVQLFGTDSDAAAGDIFADAENSIQAGPMILDPNGRLIWFKPLHHSAAFNVEVQGYHGQPALTFWQGYVIPPGVGIGTDMILDNTYNTIATVRAANGYHADLHEFQITPQGTALITAYAPIRADLRSIGGPRNGTLLDSIIQEIDIPSGRLLWEWHAYGHVHLAESYAGKPTGNPYDFFHVNSIQQLPDGNLLVSARHTWAVYKIQKRTGRIDWILGGKHSTFKIGAGAHFEWQHDAHLDGGTVTLFDNAAGQSRSNEPRSRGLRIALKFKTRKAILLNAYTGRLSVLASNQGSVQVLPDGNVFVSWGSVPYFTEFNPSGRQLFSLHFNHPLQSYRGYRFQWSGHPTTPPSISLSTSTSGVTAYASWNGATDVGLWQLLAAGPNAGAFSVVAQAQNNSFETALSTSNPGPCYAVRALTGDGHVLGTSATVQQPSGSTCPMLTTGPSTGT